MEDIYIDRVFPCSKEEAWKYWTTHEGLKSFFGRDNKIELKLYGAYEIYFDLEAPLGLRGSESCKVLSYIPEQMLSFSWNAPPSIPSIRNGDKQTFVVLFFEQISPEQCRISLRHSAWMDEGEDWIKCRNYFSEAWPWVFEQLEIVLNKN
ncbi:MAG: SRPBCC domain-containing protein, partial [Bacteroidetes bacterium]|nr:SRPBCC domain-containing protein [Bacteroidota bacterium]